MGPGLIEQTLHRLISLLQFTLLACLLICAGYQSHYIFFKALYFRIRDVQVLGNQALSKREIVRLSGLQLGDLFFEYNYEKVKERILSTPRIGEARVVVKSPNSVEIQVRERQPYFRLVHQGRSYEVDRSGTFLGPQSTGKPLPLITGGILSPGPHGLVIDGGQRELLASLVPVLEKSPVQGFTRINISSPYRVEVQWKERTVYLADPSQFERNAKLIDRLLGEAQDRGRSVATVDLRFSNVILKLAELPAETRGPSGPEKAAPESEKPTVEAKDSPEANPDEQPAEERPAR
jgi:cell division septal protein FtsQ